MFLRYTKYMCYDYKQLYNKNAAFYKAHPKALRLLLLSNLAFTGLFALAYGAFCVYAYCMEYTLPHVLKIVELPVLCLFLVSVLRSVIERPRPYSELGANITPFLEKSGSENKSFPSRHVACAFVISMVILSYLPWAGICLLPFALALAYVRFALGVHYPSDLIGGAVIGFLSGILAFIF